MKKKTTILKLSAVAVMLLALITGCTKESSSFRFLAEAETPAGLGDDKTYLENENLVYWETTDTIDAWRVGENTKVPLVFQGGSSNPKAMFLPLDASTKFEGNGTTFVALFPHNNSNSYNGSQPQVVFPSAQGYVDDHTFGHTACPMAAYGGEVTGEVMDGEQVVRMVFHNLCGLVRIQLRNSQDAKTLKRIRFTSTDGKKLSGLFNVNSIETYNPYVAATSSARDTVSITKIGQTLGNDLLTFYLPLPALSGTLAASYSITMQVVASDGSQDYFMKKNFTVPIRRNGITMMPSITIDSWGYSESESGSGIIGLAGNGTHERPFLIYTVEDLVKVRDAFKKSQTLNGVAVTSTNSEFRVMRSDIILTPQNWTEGISQFRGSFIYAANQNSNPGIENNTDIPLFESITANGTVQNVVVRGSHSWADATTSFSPLCRLNEGRMANCRVSDNASYVLSDPGTGSVGVAGICVTNSGTISGCGCRATLSAPEVAGICLENTASGKIVACYTSSPMHTNIGNSYAAYAAGICYLNVGEVKDCYFASNINAPVATQWGGIVYQNGVGGTVTHCYVDASGIIQSTTSIGGIVHTMTGGVVDNCWNDADLMNVQQGPITGGLGGIVFSLQGGEVRNCIRYRPTGSFTCTGQGVVGGCVARMSGDAIVRNCAFYGDMALSSVTVKGTLVGSVSGGTIENTYGWQTAAGSASNFYGQLAGTPTLSHCYGQLQQTGVTLSTINNLLDNLNGWSAPTSGVYMKWKSGGNNEPPILDNEQRF